MLIGGVAMRLKRRAAYGVKRAKASGERRRRRRGSAKSEKHAVGENLARIKSEKHQRGGENGKSGKNSKAPGAASAAAAAAGERKAYHYGNRRGVSHVVSASSSGEKPRG